MKVTQLSSETLDRAHERFEETLAQMTVAEANTMPAPLIKFVTWLMWHTARELDLQISALNHSDPLWLSQHWTEKFALICQMKQKTGITHQRKRRKSWWQKSNCLVTIWLPVWHLPKAI